MGKMNKNFFQSKHMIDEKIRQAERILLFLDYDGTLAPFHRDPLAVTTPPMILEEIQKIQSNRNCEIIIITGRMMNEIKQRIPINTISFAAIHGFHIELNDETKRKWDSSQPERRLMKRIHQRISDHLESQKDLNIEDKSTSIAFHYRNVPPIQKQVVIETIEQIINDIDHTHQLNIIHGAEVIEIRSTSMNKGLAVQYIQHHFSKNHPLTIYIGDDTTDEDAFEIIGEKGISVYVRNDSFRPSKARFWISSQKEVIEVLQFISASL